MYSPLPPKKEYRNFSLLIFGYVFVIKIMVCYCLITPHTKRFVALVCHPVFMSPFGSGTYF